MTEKIILLGYMGSGKSAIGKHIASILSLPFYDLDTFIEQKEEKKDEKKEDSSSSSSSSSNNSNATGYGTYHIPDGFSFDNSLYPDLQITTQVDKDSLWPIIIRIEGTADQFDLMRKATIDAAQRAQVLESAEEIGNTVDQALAHPTNYNLTDCAILTSAPESYRKTYVITFTVKSHYEVKK